MSRYSELPTPAEDPQGDYIEAAIHALNANNPRAALRYLQKGLPVERVRYTVYSRVNTDAWDNGVRALTEGTTNA